MDDPGWSWPAWKFGMKRDDLFTKLHDKYNTFASPIQDPEAFHHDVYDISTSARSTDEFHRLLAERRQQRLAELENGLESASLEIIANPQLIGTVQWQFALQLFRTKSLDSLVRYFSAYLPDDHPWCRSDASVSTIAAGSFSTQDDDDSKPFFDEYVDVQPPLTYEPLSISTNIPVHHLPPSPRSMTMCSDSSSISPVEKREEEYILNNLTPARTVSSSEPDSEELGFSASSLSHAKGRAEHCLFDSIHTPGTSVSDASEVQSLYSGSEEEEEEEESLPETQFDIDAVPVAGDQDDPLTDLVQAELEASPPTPRSETAPQAVSKQTSPTLYTQVLHEYVRSSARRGRDGSPGGSSRKSPGLSNSRVQKPLPDPIRTRPSGRRRVDC